MAGVYLLAGGMWGYISWRHRDDLLPLQRYVGGFFAFLFLEMLLLHGYYAFLNANGFYSSTGRAFLVGVSIYNAARNSISFVRASGSTPSLFNTQRKSGVARSSYCVSCAWATGLSGPRSGRP